MLFRMNTWTALLALAPITLCTSLACGSFALADDSMGRVTPTDHQLLKECMERQKTNTNVTVSKAETKRYCKDELKRQKATGASGAAAGRHAAPAGRLDPARRAAARPIAAQRAAARLAEPPPGWRPRKVLPSRRSTRLECAAHSDRS